ncbi:MAG: 50S ribosomal protein L9 [Lachnospiraceae bacterium]|nr:50S ribosomal protein L9 [Lachnospiraceae bacterium]
MKVILTEDVKSLGKKGDVVDVSDGYARNFLISKKKGVEANAANLNNLKLKNANDEKVAKENLEEAHRLADEIAKKEVTLKIKTGEGGKTFGSVSSKEIAAGAAEQCGLELDKKKIVLKDPIKTVGEYKVPVKLHPQVTAELKVIVLEEG